MPPPSDPYSRLYWRFADEFPAEYADDSTYALWCRLLPLADAAWPTAGTLPYGTKRKALDRLVAAELVVLQGGGRFRIRGMNKEREGRSVSASIAAQKRWGNADRNARGNADRNADAMLAKPSQAEKSRAEQGGGHDDDPIWTYNQLTARAPSKTVMDWLERLGSEYGEDLTSQTMASVWKSDPSLQTFLGTVETTLASKSRTDAKADEQRRAAGEKQRQAEEQARIEEMPLEQRQANLTRLRAKLQESGLLS